MERTMKHTEKVGQVDILSAARTMYLTKTLQNDMKKGVALEDALRTRLPAMDRDKLHADSVQLQNGVDSLYASQAALVDESWIEQQLDIKMDDINLEHRAKYLLNVLSLQTTVNVCEADRIRLNELREAKTYTEEDVAFLLKTSKACLYEDAGVLSRSAVGAMMKADMAHMTPDMVQELAEAGKDTAIAYAAACYILHQKGESSLGLGNQENYSAYDMGLMAASNIETSHAMSLYYIGRITLDTLSVRVREIFTAAWTLFKANIAHVIASGLQFGAGLYMFISLTVFFIDSLMLGPTVAIVGAAAVSVLTVTKLFNIKDFEDLVNGVIIIFSVACSAVFNLFHSIFDRLTENRQSRVELEETHVVDAVQVTAENTEEEEEEHEEDEEEDALEQAVATVKE